MGPNSQAILALGMTGRLGPMMLQSGRIAVISRDKNDSTEIGVKFSTPGKAHVFSAICRDYTHVTPIYKDCRTILGGSSRDGRVRGE